MSIERKRREALVYHSKPKPGKIKVIPSKKYSSQSDLALAYSPGVAHPCIEIHNNPDDVYKYTSKSNLVAVISNGTAVLGLGDIGPLAAKPVMEGKGLLFKIFADIDVFDIEIDSTDINSFIQTVKNISPTFGGINLEDIKAPEAFEIEKRLVDELDIPVMHDDQHGTAIISGAALLNALELANKKIDSIKMDRYGKLIKEMDPVGDGWDGTYLGRPMPQTDYWFRVYLEDGREFKGHFSLIRGK